MWCRCCGLCRLRNKTIKIIVGGGEYVSKMLKNQVLLPSVSTLFSPIVGPNSSPGSTAFSIGSIMSSHYVVINLASFYRTSSKQESSTPVKLHRHEASNEIKPVWSKLKEMIKFSHSFSDTTSTPAPTQPWTRPTSCRSWEYRCNNGYCIYQWDVCDGADDCGDNSDEWFCCMY